MSNPSAAPDEAVVYVGFWPRVGATLIDTIVVVVLLEVLTRLLGLDVELAGNADIDANSLQLLLNDPRIWGQLALSLLLPAVAVMWLWRRLRATPGKMAIGAEVVDARTLGPLSPMQSVIRYIGYLVSTLPLGLGLIWVGIDARKQGFHDKMAGTVVIRKRSSNSSTP